MHAWLEIKKKLFLEYIATIEIYLSKNVYIRIMNEINF